MARLLTHSRLLMADAVTTAAVDSDNMHHGALDVVDSSASGEAAFHKFLAVDAAPIGWGCTLLASVLAIVQVRQRRGEQLAQRSKHRCTCSGGPHSRSTLPSSPSPVCRYSCS